MGAFDGETFFAMEEPDMCFYGFFVLWFFDRGTLMASPAWATRLEIFSYHGIHMPGFDCYVT